MAHLWKFFRTGGFDQVRIDTAADLLHLRELDQKLWVALSCPTQGLEFDARSLALLDTNGDGHIRAPELLAAIDWAAERLADTEVLAAAQDGLPLAAIRHDGPAAALWQVARDVLQDGPGKITVAAAAAAEAEYRARAQAAWETAGLEAQPLGAATEAACAAVAAVREKINDWFMRCRLAAFDPRARDILNAGEDAFKNLGASALNTNSAAALPLAWVDARGLLPLTDGINPAWAGAIATLQSAALTPLLGEKQELGEADWQSVEDKLAPYGAWLAARPSELPAEAEAARDLERLVRYVRDLLPLANNFVAFRDFYTRQGKGIFQIGTLYLDGRSAELCVAVNDLGRHAALASLSRICLVYCECTRGGEKQSIVAAFTAGDSDQLMAGRNGVFYDRGGRDWSATVSKLVEHPISLRQAFWSPYKRLARLVGEQFQKIVGSKAKGVEDGLAAGTAAGAQKVEAAKPATVAQQAFDVGKFAGIFAAIGLAIGALGSALAAVFTGLLGLKWWQFPLVGLGIMLSISGPAVLLAWFKLRSRNLGPILDANGWAVNARAAINIPFGTTLTQVAELPDGAESSLTDPYAVEPQPVWLYVLLALSLAGAAYWFLK